MNEDIQAVLAKADDTSGPSEPSDADIARMLAEMGGGGETSGLDLGPYFAQFKNVDPGLIRRQILAVEKFKGGAFTPSDLAEIASYHAQKAHVSAVKSTLASAVKTGRLNIRPRTMPSGKPMPRHIAAFESDIIRNFAERLGGGPPDEVLDVSKGVYHTTLALEFVCEGSAANAVAYLPAGLAAEGFTLALGDAVDRLGNATTMTAIDTNLSYPGRTTYLDEIFLIEGISASLRGARVKYADADIPGGFGANQTLAAQGKTMIYDASGLYLPPQMFQSFDSSSQMAKAVAGGAHIQFNWSKVGGGANSANQSQFIETFGRLPHVARPLRESSGGAANYDVKDAYAWTLNQNQQLTEQGGNGVFSVQLEMDNEVVFPFECVTLPGGAAPVMPQKLGIYWDFRVHGTAVKKKGAEIYRKR